MSQETAPDQGLSTAGSSGAAPPKGLLRQLEELLAAVTADLAGLDADLRSPADRPHGPSAGADATIA